MSIQNSVFNNIKSESDTTVSVRGDGNYLSGIICVSLTKHQVRSQTSAQERLFIIYISCRVWQDLIFCDVYC